MLQLNVTYLMQILDMKEITITDFCAAVGIPRSTYYTWIQDPRHVRIDDVQRIANTLKIPAIDLLLE